MNYKKTLIKFMKAKAAVITNAGYDGTLYFTDEDIQDFKVMTDGQAQAIWESLITNIRPVLYNGGSSGLKASVCPWCIFKRIVGSDCNSCSYRKRHSGQFMDTNCCEDYSKLVNSIEYGGARILTNQVYRDIIEKVLQGKSNE